MCTSCAHGFAVSAPCELKSGPGHSKISRLDPPCFTGSPACIDTFPLRGSASWESSIFQEHITIIGTHADLLYRVGLVSPGTYEVVRFHDNNGNVVVKNVMTGVESIINTFHLRNYR